jgi:formylglycine-generating enzyme required for sulfatase activity
MAQLLGRGLDEASRYLVEARMQLHDPALRRQIDLDLAAQAQQETLAEFSRFVAFSVAGKVLTADAEAILVEFGQSHGLKEEQARACIEEELQRKKARRAAPPPPPQRASAPKTRAESEMEFTRIMQLANLDLADATPRVRRIFTTLGENLGVPLERAEHLLDEYLDADAYGPAKQAPPTPLRAIRPLPRPQAPSSTPKAAEPAPQAQPSFPKPIPANLPPMFNNPVGAPMKLIPAGEFIMGSDAPEAAADEQPLTPVTLHDFYMGHYPVTNAEYEKFDPKHKLKRIKGAGDDHPVVYVTSHEATKFCEWLRQKDGRNYRLPTEAEWEYAARGSDGRIYPWGNTERRGDLANFADASTTFAWRDPLIADGYPETGADRSVSAGAELLRPR